MNKQQAKDLTSIIQAFAEGKKIEFRELGSKYWNELTNPAFNLNIYEYRIKPEPEYRLFVNAEECWQEMLKHQPFGWIKALSNKCFYSISEVRDGGCVFSNGDLLSFETLFKFDTFTDGAPFGIKVEE